MSGKARTLPLVFLLFALASTAQSTLAACPRIVSQSPYITQTLQWLELEPCIVGVGRYDTLDLPRTGGILDPDAEAIALLQPQLMLNTDWLPADKWQALAPAGTQAVTLHGFDTMAQMEDNIRRIGVAAGLTDADDRAAAFSAAWRTRAAEVRGADRRVLLLSACSGTPYSFGRHTWLHDLFSQAGFTVVETEEKLRHLRALAPISDIGALADTLNAEVLFVFERRDAQQCQLIRPQRPLPIVLLDGDNFLHPAPAATLRGLTELQAKRAQWSP